MATLDIALLGHPEVTVDGAPLDVDTRKAVALVAYLATTGRPHGRDALAGLLWPESDQTRARAALRRTLSVLGRALGGRWLAVDRTAVSLRDGEDEDVVTVDVARFRERLRAGRAGDVDALADAVATYRGDFLAGFSLRDSAEFDDWAFFTAEELRRDMAGALEALVDGLVAQGRPQDAIAPARRWLSLDALHEPAHQRLMRLYHASGQRAAALRQYAECVRILDRELGVEPLEETTRLHVAIRDDRTPPAPPPAVPRDAAAPAPAAPAPVPLVGRGAELEAVTAVLSAAAGRVVVVEGEPGIGKTRLAEEALARVRRGGVPALAARCHEGEDALAYRVVVEWVRAALADAGAAARLAALPDRVVAEASRLVPELADGRATAAAPLDGPGAQARFVDALVEVVLAGARGGVLYLDDVQWADSASLDVLSTLARRLDDDEVRLLLGWRREDVPPRHPLRRLAGDAARAGTGLVATLGRLAPEEVADLVDARAADAGWDADTRTAVAARLHAETEGVPFFVVAYLGSIGGDPAWTLPASVRDALEARLDAVGDASRQVLAAGAVLGRAFDVETVRDVSGRSEDETVTALEELTARGLLVEAGDGQGYDFAHHKIRHLVHDATSLARRRLLHRRAGDVLAAGLRGRRDRGALAAVVAGHHRLAGRDADAADFLVEAGDHARAVFANAEAVAHYESALALGHPEPARLCEALGDLQTLLGDYAAARARYEQAAAHAGRDGLAAVEHKLGGVHHRLGEWGPADSHFAAALAALGPDGDPGRRARILADRAVTAQRRGRLDTAVDLAADALALAEADGGDPRALAQAHNVAGMLANARGDQTGARGHLERSLAVAEALGDVGGRAAALNNLALVHRARGELDEAVALTSTALSLCSAQGDRHREAALHNNLADLHHAAGRPEEAMAHLKQAVALFAEIGGAAGTAAAPAEVWKLVDW